MKQSGKKSLSQFSKTLIKAAGDNEDKFFIMIKDSDGKTCTAENPTIMKFKGLKVLCFVKGDKTSPDDNTFNTETLTELMKEQKIKKLGELDGLVAVDDPTGQKNDEVAKNSYIVTNAEASDKQIILTLSNANMNDKKEGAGRAEMYAM